MSAPAMLFLGLLGSAILVLCLVGFGRRWGILVPFGLMLLMSAMAIPVDWYGNMVSTIWLPVQSRRADVYMVAGIIACGMLVLQLKSLSGSRVAFSSLLFLFASLYAALLRFYHSGPTDGLQSFVFVIVTLIPLLFVASLADDGDRGIVRMLRVIMAVCAVWVAMCGMQFVANSEFLTMGNEFRFVGLTGNPQHAGVLVAFWAVVALWLLLNDRVKLFKFVYIGLLGVNLIMLIWSGSRTGMGMSVIGFAAVMYTRMGKAILFAPAVLIVAYFGVQAVLSITGLDIGVDRLTSTKDTRTDAWITLIQTGMSSPILGVGTDEAERSENSWLYAFATYGIGLLALTILIAAAAFFEVLRGVRFRSYLASDERRQLDLCLGIVAMYFAGALLEGYMVARVTAPTCFFIVFSCLTVVLARRGSLIRSGAYAGPDAYGDGYDGDHSEYGDDGDHGEEYGKDAGLAY